MATQTWSLHKVHGNGTTVEANVSAVRLDGITGPNSGVVSTAHNIAAGFTLVRAWVILSNGRIMPDNVTALTIDATNAVWAAATGINLSAFTGEIIIEYIPA